MVTNNAGNIPTGTSGTVLQGQGAGASLALSTSTYPATNNSGDLLYGSASNAIGRLAIGTVPGTGPIYNGTNLAYYNPLQNMIFFDDFVGANAATTMSWDNYNRNSANFNNPIAIDSGHPGVVQFELGTAANGVVGLRATKEATTNGFMFLGGGTVDMYMVLKLSALSTGTNTYALACGFGDGDNTPNPSFDNGVFFNYSSTVNSGQWQGSTSNTTTKSTVNSSIAATTSWTTLRLNVNAAASLCTFYVNGTSIGTLSTNIPTTTIGPYFQIVRSVSDGSTDISMYLDLVYVFQPLTSAR